VVAADVILDVGTMPAADPGGEGALGWAYHVAPWRVRALLSGALFVPIDKSATGHQGLFTLYSGTGRACVSIGPGVLDIGPCLGMAFEDITGSGRGAPQVADRSGTRVALVGSVLASWRFSPNASLFARADGLIPLHSPAFVWLESTGPRLVYQPAPGAARGAIGVELRFF
jgi:hypothetical protein